ncbi:MAG TPA: capsule assembly Wzi family protein [Acidobacteriaceae bacterium]|jgi:hypothetical protein|nr:capsule assembly Wzi family protein [Acidobacteriaceae bacterium]
MESLAQKNSQNPFPANYDPSSDVITVSSQGSTYVPMDSWIYPALDRLHSLGYIDSAFMGLRPWTRLSIAHMLERSADQIDMDTNNDDARAIYRAVLTEVQPDLDDAADMNRASVHLDSVYTNLRGISGTPLRDSYHLGQTLINDYGRPYEGGFNNYSGFSGRAEAGRFSLYFRGEYQHAASAGGYSAALATYLSEDIDGIPIATNPHQDTIPEGPIPAANNMRVMEANLSYHLLGHEISFGKSDHWLGPDKGAAMLWSDNAEDVYTFQIDRVEPLRIPGISRVMGPIRYDFFVGSLKGHTDPNDPWVHVEKISFKPTRDLELGFDRMVIWGGKDHEPITLHTFLKSFFSFQNVTLAEKFSRDDPGARFGTFDFDWRLPHLQKWVTLYADSLVHDDVSPISAPRRAGYHPGIYLAQFPKLHQMDLRLEGSNTEPTSHANPYPGPTINQGQFLYYEGIQKQGPTNKGFLVGDWTGRQGKGGQVWLTYHLSPQEDIQVMYRRAKAAPQFIPGGTTQNDFAVSVRKRFARDYEVRGLVQYEGYKAPILTYPVFTNTEHSDTVVEGQITWYPKWSSH